MDKQIEQDKLLLKSLGGYSEVARMLSTSPQRVFNWSKRGIPASVKLEHKELFLKEFSGRQKRKAPRRNVGQGLRREACNKRSEHDRPKTDAVQADC